MIKYQSMLLVLNATHGETKGQTTYNPLIFSRILNVELVETEGQTSYPLIFSRIPNVTSIEDAILLSCIANLF